MNFRLLIATALVAAAPAADAATRVTVTGDYSATFTIATGQLPDSSDDEVGFAYYDQPFAAGSVGIADFVFYNDANGGGLEISDFAAGVDLFEGFGPALYTGSAFDPTFVTGPTALTGPGGVGSYTVTIATVTEPASWALLVTGFGLAGVTVRRRRAVAV